jgi:hypothetical protein
MPGAAVHAMIEGLAARLELIDGIPAKDLKTCLDTLLTMVRNIGETPI